MNNRFIRNTIKVLFKKIIPMLSQESVKLLIDLLEPNNEQQGLLVNEDDDDDFDEPMDEDEGDDDEEDEETELSKFKLIFKKL